MGWSASAIATEGADRQRVIWSVTHDGEKAPGHLAVEGEPPAVLASIEANLRRRQADDDAEDDDLTTDYIFEIPLTLAEAITGFRIDEAEMEWEEVVSTHIDPAVRSTAACRLGRMLRMGPGRLLRKDRGGR